MENNPVNTGMIGEHHRVAETEYLKSVGGKTKRAFLRNLIPGGQSCALCPGGDQEISDVRMNE